MYFRDYMLGIGEHTPRAGVALHAEPIAYQLTTCRAEMSTLSRERFWRAFTILLKVIKFYVN